MFKWIRKFFLGIKHWFLLREINTLLKPYGCLATGISLYSVGTQGDARTFYPSVIVRFSEHMSFEEISAISNEITNKTRVSRVLMEIAPSSHTGRGN